MFTQVVVVVPGYLCVPVSNRSEESTLVGTYLVELITVVQPNESLITYTCKNVYHGTSNFVPVCF